jgi:hypothetical protein
MSIRAIWLNPIGRLKSRNERISDVGTTHAVNLVVGPYVSEALSEADLSLRWDEQALWLQCDIDEHVAKLLTSQADLST